MLHQPPASSHRVHQTNLGRAPPRLRLGCGRLEGGEAGPPRQGDVADVGRVLGGNTWGGGGVSDSIRVTKLTFVNDESSLLQISSLMALGLPELLQLLHHIDWEIRGTF